VDLLVPAEAEIVLEGYVNTEYLEPESPFGESHGYICLPEYNAFMDLTAITRKKHPILSSWLSQVSPSESSVIKRASYEPMFLDHLRTQLGIRGVTRVSMHEPLTSLSKLMILQFERGVPTTEIWRALYGIASLRQHEGKWLIAVDQDIDPDNADAVFWAMSYRCKPHRDLITLAHQDEGSGPHSLIDKEDSAVLIDATLKEAFPPVSLPKREFMENAAEIWDELGLPKLRPEAPWFGYDLGEWNEGLEVMARRAVRGDYWDTGKIIAQRRRNDIPMNTEIRTLGEGNPGASGGGGGDEGEMTWDGLKDASRS
jgi:4-hydroxy-3-polyprenylbenzoate decarboxylase